MAFPTTILEHTDVNLQFALVLRDRYAGSQELLGQVSVTAAGVEGAQKGNTGTFLFFNLKPGARVFAVASDPLTPYYRGVSIPITIPMPAASWPAYPDVTLANPALPLGDPGQPASFRDQWQQAELLPATAYPFAEGTTLARGVVTAAGSPLAGATVQTVGGQEIPYTTGPSGEYVLFFEQPARTPQTVTLRASHAGFPDKNVSVVISRGFTAAAEIAM
jgi:hypothetical protein